VLFEQTLLLFGGTAKPVWFVFGVIRMAIGVAGHGAVAVHVS
jgi:hypothetical protein